MRGFKMRPLVMAAVILVGSVGAAPNDAEARTNEGERRHLVWDPVDLLWRCLGSPMKCIADT